MHLTAMNFHVWRPVVNPGSFSETSRFLKAVLGKFDLQKNTLDLYSSQKYQTVELENTSFFSFFLGGGIELHSCYSLRFRPAAPSPFALARGQRTPLIETPPRGTHARRYNKGFPQQPGPPSQK